MRKQDQGFSIMELMVVLGLAGMLAMISVGLQSQVLRVTRSVENSLNLNSHMSKIGSVLADPRSCSENFEGLEFDAETWKAPITESIFQYNFDRNTRKEIVKISRESVGSQNNEERGQEPSSFSPDYSLKEAYFKKVGQNAVELNLSYQKIGTRSANILKEITRSIKIFAVLDGTKLVSCKSDLTGLEEEIVTSACRDITGVEIEPGADCEIHAYEKTVCPDGSYLTGFVAEGKIIKPTCSSIDISSSSNSLVNSYSVNGTGSIDGNELDVYDIEDSFSGGDDCPHEWNGTIQGTRFNRQLNQFRMTDDLKINCL